MKIVRTPEGVWELHNSGNPVRIDGETKFESYESLATRIESRGMFVWNDGTIRKEAEPYKDVEDPVEAIADSTDAEEKRKAKNKATYQKRKDRYQNDPEYRAKVLSYQKQRREQQKNTK